VIPYIIICCSVAVIVTGQLLFKLAAQSYVSVPGHSLLESVVDNRKVAGLVLLALTLYALSTVGWIYALRRVPLSIAYLFNAMSFILLPPLCNIFFGEPINRSYVYGATLIVLGIIVTLRGSNS